MIYILIYLFNYLYQKFSNIKLLLILTHLESISITLIFVCLHHSANTDVLKKEL